MLEREIDDPERCACAGYMCYGLVAVTDHIHQKLRSERIVEDGGWPCSATFLCLSFTGTELSVDMANEVI
ncbi:hypothetical protein EYF80_042806 [Liparis tanakae]|uniref:Uncharacterized protein n=1 Tax=Liparis tanakae TaxID=230148 RepID=A0A4Z2G282_9TELE|nr:hypothetical protein EYF80_042806 [Liparis tanakae]